MTQGIEGSKDLLKLVVVMADAFKAAKADGVINIFDLPKLAPVIPALKAAVENASLVPMELKELDIAETAELLELAVSALTKILDAVFTVHA